MNILQNRFLDLEPNFCRQKKSLNFLHSFIEFHSYHEQNLVELRFIINLSKKKSIEKKEETIQRESYLPVAPCWYQGTEAEHASILQSISQLRGKKGLQKAWCLFL